jgi:hypothetical protein
MKLREYFNRGSQMIANTGWFYGLIFAIAGVVSLNPLIFLFGVCLMIADKIIERNDRKWKERQRAKAESKS